MILNILIVLIVQLFVVQGDIDVILKDVECVVYSNEYLSEPETYVDDQNGLFLNATVKKMFPETSEGYFVLVGASLGEYVVPTGMDVRMPLCDMLDEPVIVGPMIRDFGFSEDNCPPQPGIYGSESYVLPSKYFPDDFPANQYKAVFEITNENEKLFALHFFVDIQ